MSRQITVSRTELSLPSLDLNDATNGYYVSDEWSQGGYIWQRYEASTSPFAHGETIVAQRLQNVDEIFTIYVFADTTATLNSRLDTLREAFSQYRYTLTIEWDGVEYIYDAAGAADIRRADTVNPILHKAGWHSYQISVPRRPEV